ncbi:hypothetical protein Tco_1060357 [Tanacetum coccineum]
MDSVKPRALTTGRYAIDVESILPRNRNNREELLEYVIGTCPKDFNQRDKNHDATHLARKKQVTFEDQCETSNGNTHKRVEQLNFQKTNVLVPPSTGVNRKVLTNVGYQWRPTRKIFTLGEQCPLTRLTIPKVVPAMQTENVSTSKSVITKKLSHTAQKPTVPGSSRVIQIVLWYLDSGCSKHMTGDHSRLRNFMKKFTGIVRFRNDHFGAFMGYGDYVIGDSVISRVYYVEGLRHNLFSVREFCDFDLEVAFRKHSCYVHDTDGVELIKGSHGSNFYTISVKDMINSSPVCLLSKASKNKSWL